MKSSDAPPREGGGKRILILCGDDAPPVAAGNVYAELFKDHEVRFVEERILTLRRIWNFSRRRFRRLGLFSLLGVYMLYAAQFLRCGKKARKRYTPVLVTTNISGDPAVERLMTEFKPDVMIIGFCGLLAPDFLRKAGQTIYNTHPGINPRYRGFGNIWAFYENDFATAGYTIHEIDAGIDTGERVAAAHVCFAGVPFEENEIHVAALAARHMASLVLGRVKPYIPEEFRVLGSRCYGVPTLGVYRAARANYNSHLAAIGLPPGGAKG